MLTDMRRTKIVCTIGPATSSAEMIEALIKAGMNVARLNFSHGDHAEHLDRIKTIRRAAARLGRTVGILQDLPGPKIRIGRIKNEPAIVQHRASFVFTTKQVEGDANQVTLPFPGIVRAIKRGAPIYVDDAKLEFRVVSTTDTEIVTRVIVGGELGSNKGFTAPGIDVDVPGVTEKDVRDLRFGLENGVDWVANSFVRRAEDIAPLRAEMARAGCYIPIIAKIERPEAVQNIQEIINAYDGVMVARGDMGIELPIDRVPEIQKNIIRHCNRAGKPVITATQMLDSMIHNSRPTRAEVTDVANAIIDGTDATMLSGETAMGDYPLQAVRVMDRVARRTEKSLDYRAILQTRMQYETKSVTEAIGEAAVKLAADLDVPTIITCTFGGATARLVSKYRPRARIIAAASNEQTARTLALSWGVTPICVPLAEDTDELVRFAVEAVRERKLAREGSSAVIIAGIPVGEPGNTSLIRVVRIDAECLGAVCT